MSGDDHHCSLYNGHVFHDTSSFINDKSYVTIALGEGNRTSLSAGAPDLPSRYLEVLSFPNDVTMKVRVGSQRPYARSTHNIFVAPSKGNLPRTINPADVPYEFSDIYTQNIWYPAVKKDVQEPSILKRFPRPSRHHSSIPI